LVHRSTLLQYAHGRLAVRWSTVAGFIMVIWLGTNSGLNLGVAHSVNIHTMYSIEILTSELYMTQLWCNHNYMFEGVEYSLEYLDQQAVRVTFKYADHYHQYCHRHRQL
jgi:methyl coenzyme M reductase alpha subunit